MKAKPFTDRALEQFIQENLENGYVTTYTDPKFKPIEFHYYDELPNLEVNGFPVSSDFVGPDGKVYSFEDAKSLDKEKRKNLRLRYAYMPYCHDIYVGTTGSGKTTGAIEPQIRAISRQKNKANIFVTDPKGELFQHNARYLKKMGYQVFVLNFKDFGKTDRWNPLLEIYEAALKVRDVGVGHSYKNGPVPEDMEQYSKYGDFKKGYIEYEGKAFASKKDIDEYLRIEYYLATSKVSSLVSQFTTSALPTKSTKDPSWEEGARGFLFGIIMGLAEEVMTPKSKLTADMFTLKTIYDTYNLLRASVLDGSRSDIRDKARNFLKNKSKLVREKINGVLETADGTRKGYFSTFESRLVDWFQGHIYVITSGTTIKIDDDKPFAIFVSTRDYEKSDFIIAGTFIDWVYRQTLIKAENAPKDEFNNPTTRDIHFLLDEFGNIPQIPAFENKIATARSRKIWFHLIVQSYEQIELIYGKETASIVIDNCNMQVFLGSQSLLTKKKFSEECGKKSVRSVASRVRDSRTTDPLTEVSVVPVSQLDLIRPGEFYAKRIYCPVIKGSFIRSYMAAELGYFEDFRDAHAFRDIAPLNTAVPDDELHTYLAVSEVGKTYVSTIVDPGTVSPGVKERNEEEESPAEEKISLDDLFNRFGGGTRN